ncbi:PAS domain-containing sensor histidine kinase [Rugamonas sp. CCM 8940]|uniref:PAS domain-containing sensor histidine kinase n=1 Tax=Rugamonas sp. CCM 8940 TaxID=2765359 RepID=UPI0018F78E23|nr:ATP-binding protein [Rugamonas sp. CCM 8940]MBJ7313177.1 PAS domain S-box protein [Rugamonas sp. CCM 8940]
MAIDFGSLILKETPDAVILTTPGGEVLCWSPGAVAVFGYDADEAVGRQLDDLIVPPGHGAEDDAVRGRALVDGSASYETMRRAKDGALVYVDGSAKAIRDAAGAAEYILWSKKDVTQLKVLRDAQLLEARYGGLLESTPDAIVMVNGGGRVVMRLPGPLNEPQDKQLRTIQASARHLLSLINDLLDLTRIESGKIELHFEQPQCRALVEELLQSFQPLARDKGLRLASFCATPDDIVLLSDRRALQQILIDLVNNAVKFTERGEVAVRLSVAQVEQRECVTFSVSDTGVGIAAEHRDKLFHAFTQLDAGSARQYEGSGLGLHLSQKLAGLLHGQILFDGRAGEGSTFTLALPLD